MLNVSEVLYDSDFNQDFKVYRKTGEWVAGRFVENESIVNLTGVVVPASAQEINQQPEGDRITGMMKFYSEQQIYTTHVEAVSGTSDQIEWRGKRYRIINCMPYVDYGYYVAFGAYMAGD
ncbi:MAG: hypothetical protein ACYC6C_11780 [Coriobacteriia bacterium]